MRSGEFDRPPFPDLSRVAAVATTDSGLFVLAVCSFIEGYLSHRYPDTVGVLQEFRERLARLRFDLEQGQGFGAEHRELFSLIRQTYRNSNRVRHDFTDLDVGEALSATNNLLRLCELLSIQSPAIAELSKSLDLWRGRSTPLQQLERLKQLQLELNHKRGDVTSLQQQVERLQATEKRAYQLEEELRRKTEEVTNLTIAGNKPSARVESLRREIHTLKRGLMDDKRAIAGNTDARRYIEYLQRFTTYTRSRSDYERSVLHLTPEQAEAVRLIGGIGDFLVTGSAGTGKTLVLLHALRNDLREREAELRFESDHEVALLTFTPGLVRFNLWLTHLIGDLEMAPLLATVEGFFASRLRKLHPDLQVSATKVSELLPTQLPIDARRAEMADEIDRVIIATRCSRTDYLQSTPRAESRLQPDDHQRAAIWDEAQRILRALKQQKEKSPGYVRRLLWDAVENDAAARDNMTVKRIFVDEAQDLDPGDLALLKHLSQTGLVIAGDRGQAIWRLGMSYRQAGILVQGRAKVLRANFRNTRPIRDIATAWRMRNPEDVNDTIRSDAEEVLSWREGPLPEFETYATAEDLYTAAAKRLVFLRDTLDYEPESLAVLTLFDKEVEALAAVAHQSGFETADVRHADFDFEATEGVRVSTVREAKGIEFPVVILLMPNVDFLHKHDAPRYRRLFRNLIYVALTRPMDYLVIMTSEVAARHKEIQSLRDIVRESGDDSTEANSTRGSA